MSKVDVVEGLIEKLEDYNQELYDEEESGEERDPYYDDYILDDVLKLKKVLYESGVEEGRAYQEFILKTDKDDVKVYDVLEVERFMSGKVEKVQVMSIERFRVNSDGNVLVEFLGKVLR